MDISTLVNQYGEKYSPYMSGIVNHLPMAQMALYKMTENLRKVEDFTIDHISRYRLDPVKKNYPKSISIHTCLGKRDRYESVLDRLKEDVYGLNIEEYISYILNTYDLGISSGLFHPIIRIKHAIDGYEIDKNSIDEVKRALSYYITSYRQADVFKGKTNVEGMVDTIEELLNNKRIKNLLAFEKTTGRKLRALYNDQEYLKSGILIDGNSDQKAQSLLGILIPAFINSGNIIALHCITGLEALLSLEGYYDDFDRALDIFTTSAITHLMTLDKINFRLKEVDEVDFSWNYILDMGTSSRDVHNIKFTYSCYEIFKRYPIRGLKRATLKRIDIAP